MIENTGKQSWTVYGSAAVPGGWSVTATTWTNNGPGTTKPSKTVYATQVEADDAARDLQTEYDALRKVLLDAAREVNQEDGR